MSADAGEVERFLRIIIAQARRATRWWPSSRGLLQLCTLDPDDERPWQPGGRFDPVHGRDELIASALRHSERGRNVFIEGRTLRPDSPWRGKMFVHTKWVFALVIDSDADKSRAWAGDVEASLVVETSAGTGNTQHWFFLETALIAEDASVIGAAMRAFTRTDADSGVPVQPYRIAGLINYPDAKKRARGRVPVPSRIIAHRPGALWTPAGLRAAFPPPPVRKVPPPPPPPVGIGGSKRKPPSVRRSAPNALPSEEILERYPRLGADLREQLACGPCRGEDRSRMRMKLAHKLFERGVTAEDAFVLLVNTPWNPTGDEADPKRLVKMKWGVEIE